MHRNDVSGEPPWASLAYFLWSQKHRSPWRIAQLLDGEGWEVTDRDVYDVVTARAARELERKYQRRRGL